MKKLTIIFQDLISLIKHEKESLLLILASLGLSVGVSLSMISFFSSNVDVFRDMKTDKATYRLYFSASFDDETPMEIFDRLFLSEDSLVVRDAYYAVSFSTYPSSSPETISYTKDSSETGYGTQPPTAPNYNISWRCVFPDERLAPLADRPEEPALSEGRWFSPEEIKTGAAVAVVGRDNFPDAKIGDSIIVLGREVRVIGIRKERNTLPYVLMRQLSGKKQGFFPNSFVCVFDKPLSEVQLEELARSGITENCLFDIRKSGYFIEIASMLAVSGGIFLLAVLNALGMFKHLILAARYRFMVLKVCGAGQSTVFWGLYRAPLFISALSSICGTLLYRLLLEPWIIDQFKYEALPFWLLSAVCAIVLLLCFLCLLPTVRRVTKAQPAETALWR